MLLSTCSSWLSTLRLGYTRLRYSLGEQASAPAPAPAPLRALQPMQRDSRGFYTLRTTTPIHLCVCCTGIDMWTSGDWREKGRKCKKGTSPQRNISKFNKKSFVFATRALKTLSQGLLAFHEATWLTVQHSQLRLLLPPIRLHCLRYILHVRCIFTLRIFSNNFSSSLCHWCFFLSFRVCVWVCVYVCLCGGRMVGVACVCKTLTDLCGLGELGCEFSLRLKTEGRTFTQEDNRFSEALKFRGNPTHLRPLSSSLKNR